MSARTFYLAAASENVSLARERIAELEALGMTCLCDWTGLDAPESAWPRVSQEEIDAVLDADMFVACSPVSPGVAFEVGVRVTGGYLTEDEDEDGDGDGDGDEVGDAHLVGEWLCPFARGSRVIHHATWPEFLSWLKA